MSSVLANNPKTLVAHIITQTNFRKLGDFTIYEYDIWNNYREFVKSQLIIVFVMLNITLLICSFKNTCKYTVYVWNKMCLEMNLWLGDW